MKSEIITKLENLVKLEFAEEVFTDADELKNEYIRETQKENDEALDLFVREGGNPGNFEAPKSFFDSRFNELIHILSDRESKFKKVKREEFSARLHSKREVIEELEKLMTAEVTIGKAFQRFKDLQVKWNEAGSIHSAEYKRLQSVYARHSHNFYYNMKLSKDLKELDFKRNLEFRTSLISKIESLLQIESIKGVERMLTLYRNEWNELGPTAPEVSETLKTRYRELIRELIQRIRGHYANQRKTELENLEAKKVLLERALKAGEESFDTARQWHSATDALDELMTEWKKTGFAPKKENEKIWKLFRDALNVFHKKKKDFFVAQKKVYKENKEKKLAIVAKADAIANATHEAWEDPTHQIQQLQKDWKEAGNLEQKDENKLWKQLRDACDKFFNAKRESFNQRDAGLMKNLDQKEELIKRLDAFELTGKKEDDLKTLQNFSAEWKEIPHVPYKEKERIYEMYKKVLDKKYDGMKLDSSQRHMMKFKSNVDELKGSERSEMLIQKERMNIKERINKLQNTINQYENNLGFFSNAKSMGSLLKDAQDTLAKAKEEMEMMKNKLKMLSETEVKAIPPSVSQS